MGSIIKPSGLGKCWFFLAIVFCTVACKKQKSTFIPVNDSLQAVFNFQPGTYWIYEDAVTGLTDSFFVTGNSTTTTANGSYNVQFINIAISAYGIGAAFTDTQSWTFSYQSNMFDLSYTEAKVSPGKVNYAPLVNYPFADSLTKCAGCIAVSDPGQNSVFYLYDSMLLNGQIFHNVAEINHFTNFPANGNFGIFDTYDLFYICPNIGIVKMSLNHPEDSVHHVWELQRWNIVK